MNEHEPITIAELQRRIGFRGDREGRRLRRQLELREKSSGATIIIRKPGCWPRVTLAAVRRYAPDLIPNQLKSVDTLLRETRRYLESIDEKISNEVAEQIAARVAPELQRIRRDIDEQRRELREQKENQLKIAETVNEVGKRMAAIAR